MTDRPTGPATAAPGTVRVTLDPGSPVSLISDPASGTVHLTYEGLDAAAAERARILSALPEALRTAMSADDSEPLDAEGFCEHELLGGAGCSEWEHSWSERVAAALAAAIEKELESTPTQSERP